MQKRIVIATSDLDIHQAALLVQNASRFESHILISVAEKHANAKSIMGLVSLKIGEGLSLEIEADGPDEALAVNEIAAIFIEIIIL